MPKPHWFFLSRYHPRWKVPFASAQPPEQFLPASPHLSQTWHCSSCTLSQHRTACSTIAFGRGGDEGCFSYPCLMPQGPAEMVPFSQALLSRPPSLGVSGPTKFPTCADTTARVLQFVIVGDCRSASLLLEQWGIL